MQFRLSWTTEYHGGFSAGCLTPSGTVSQIRPMLSREKHPVAEMGWQAGLNYFRLSGSKALSVT